MPLWKDGARIDGDPWRLAADGEVLPADGPAIVPLARWRAEREALIGRNQPLGLFLPNDSDWEDIVPDLARFPVIAVAFPKLFDGRGFSVARLLRQRDGYVGEIRATGIFTIDQMPLMKRVGIDAFEVNDPNTLAQLERGVWPEVPQYLQPIDDGAEVPAGTRPWARRHRPGRA